MNNEIKIMYIDDEIDPNISRFLHHSFQNNYEEKAFNCQKGYESLLCDKAVTSANIIIIDSRLFENKAVQGNKFTGEEFKIILKKFTPFIEVLVITQSDNIDNNERISKLHKFKDTPDNNEDSDAFYKRTLLPEIEKAKESIETYRLLAGKIKQNDVIDKALVEKILNAIDGIYEYDELKTSDVDRLIEEFKKIKEQIDGRL